MWRTHIQTKCSHGIWQSEFGTWDGLPSDPWWFRPEIPSSDFLNEAMQNGLKLHTVGDFDESPLKDLDCIDGSQWFVMEAHNLLSYKFTDPTRQLSRMAHALYEYALHHQICLKNLRVLMYMSPRQTT